MSNKSNSNSNGEDRHSADTGMRRGLCEQQDMAPEHDTAARDQGRTRGRGMRNLRAIFSTIKNTFTTLATLTVNKKSRRRRLTETNQTPCHSPATPQTRCRKVLGRTPAKLYSPFGIETPHNDFKSDSIYNPDTPEHGFSPKKKSYKFNHQKWNIVSRKPRALFR